METREAWGSEWLCIIYYSNQFPTVSQPRCYSAGRMRWILLKFAMWGAGSGKLLIQINCGSAQMKQKKLSSSVSELSLKLGTALSPYGLDSTRRGSSGCRRHDLVWLEFLLCRPGLTTAREWATQRHWKRKTLVHGLLFPRSTDSPPIWG